MAKKNENLQELENKNNQITEEQDLLEDPEPVENDIADSAGDDKSGKPDDSQLQQVTLNDFNEARKIKEKNSLDLLKDVPLKVVVELGRTVLKINDLMELGVGSIIELNKLYGDPVDIYVNNKLIGRGEVVVIDEDFAVRITQIVTNS
jgi:flagellar motor switch protein FliN